jgi:hypothetical protein
MDQNPNDNPCVCCGEYAVTGSWLCWKCQQKVTNTKVAKDHFIENYLKTKKALDKSKNV